MANYSDLTRKEQVLARLKAANGGWVDGPDLANEECGGSEGLRRLRELVDDGHNVRKRQHPDATRDIWQYRLVPPPLDIPIENDGIDGPTTTAGFLAQNIEKALDTLPAPEPSEPPTYPKPEPQTRMSTAVKRKEDGTFEYVPPQRPIVIQPILPEPETQLASSEAFTSLPKKISFGEVAVCPRCRQKTKRGQPQRKTTSAEAERKRQIMLRRRGINAEDAPLIDDDGVLLYRDPHERKPRPCSRCNGYGIVPNKGPIALAPISPTPPPAPLDLGDEAETTEAFPE